MQEAPADSTLFTITRTGKEFLRCHVFEADRNDSKEDTSGTSRSLLRLLRTVKDNDDDLKADILNELTSLSTKESKLSTCQAEVCQSNIENDKRLHLKIEWKVISFRSQGSEDSRRSHLYLSGKIVSRYINLNPEV
ncbi:unnamed protein product, partial [Porites lobata]